MWGVSGLISNGLDVPRETCLKVLFSDLKKPGRSWGSQVLGSKRRGMMGGSLGTAVNLKQSEINCLLFRKALIASFCFSERRVKGQPSIRAQAPDKR